MIWFTDDASVMPVLAGLRSRLFCKGKAMNETAQIAMKTLNRKLQVPKEDSQQRGRLNLKQYIEECIALLNIIERNSDAKEG